MRTSYTEIFICTNSKFVNDFPVKIFDIFEKKYFNVPKLPHLKYILQRLKASVMLNDGLVDIPKYWVHFLNVLEMGTIR